MHSHSSTQSFNTCPYKYKLEKVDGLVQSVYRVEDNDRVWGQSMHLGFKLIHEGQRLTQAVDAFTAAYPNDLGGARELAWTREGGIRTLEAYAERYELMSTEWETLGVELDNRELGELETEEGHLVIDWVARQRASGSIYFWDHKFKHKINSTTLKQYELDAQVTRYAAYVSAKYGECAGCVIQMVCPRYLMRASQINPKGWSFQFEIGVYNRSPEAIQVWRDEQSDWEAMIEWCKREDRWPRHKGYNCTRCIGYDVCYAEREGGSSEHVRATMTEGALASDDMVVTFEED